MAVMDRNYCYQVTQNNIKMGAYYTDLAHCCALSECLVWPEEEVACLEPSVGDAEAVLEIAKARNNENRKIFAVELNQAVAEETREKVEELLCADFLEIKCAHNVFSFCFCNPPYMDDDLAEDGRERTEKQFLLKVTDYLTKGALMLWVVPYKSFTEISQFRYMAQRYEILKAWKFRGDEYAKYHQVCVVLRKKEPRLLLKDELDALRAKYSSLEDIEELPKHPEERFEVYPSDPEKVFPFCEKTFDKYKACQTICSLQESTEFEDINKILNRRLTVKKYSFGKAGRPPIPPKKDTLYLMATSGYGAGLTGSAKRGDLHLQRGVAEVVEETVYEPNPSDPEKEIARVTSRTQVTMTVVQNDGTITVLE